MSDEAYKDFNHRMAWVSAVSTSNVGHGAETKQLVEVVRTWAEVKKQVVLAEMAHRWRVDAVTHRYQQHMEKVRCAAPHLALLKAHSSSRSWSCCQRMRAQRMCRSYNART